jgi:hypothetical protein
LRKKKTDAFATLDVLRAWARYFGPRINAAVSPQLGITSVRSKRAGGNIDGIYDQTILLCESNGNKGRGRVGQSQRSPPSKSTSIRWDRAAIVPPYDLELRRRPRPNRIGRHCQVIVQSGLEVFLLLTQPVAAIEGAQLAAERPK